jgi:hypothetical protein
MRQGARTCRLRDHLSRPPQPATTAQQFNPVASRLRRAGPPGPSTAVGAAAAFLISALGYPQWQGDRTPGAELAAGQEAMSAYLDFPMAAVTGRWRGVQRICGRAAAGRRGNESSAGLDGGLGRTLLLMPLGHGLWPGHGTYGAAASRRGDGRTLAWGATGFPYGCCGVESTNWVSTPAVSAVSWLRAREVCHARWPTARMARA